MRPVNRADDHVGSSSPPDVTVRYGARGVVRDQVIDTLTTAFHGDPLYRWLFDDPTTRPQALRDNFTLVTAAAVANGRLDATSAGDAAAIWTDPGQDLFDDPAEMLTVLARWASRARVAQASRSMEECSRNRPTDAAVLQLIGVRPAHAGAGIGSALIGRRLAELDRLGQTAYLESSNPRNHTFYARHGFVPVADVLLDVHGPSVRCMVRPPLA